ncbi:MAG: IS66 family transposase [Parachlamydiaceae bacterium]
MKPTYEELEFRLKESQEAHEKTLHILKLALERIASLEERINKNSKNSSKSPSSDRKGNTDSPKGDKKPRGGINRKLIPPEKIDQFITCSLDLCPDCGSKDLLDEGNHETLQQVELPEIKAIVTEFSCKKYKCTCCGNRSIANLPTGIPNSSFGLRLMALIANLTGVLHLSKRDAIHLLKDLYGIDVCEGSIINVEERVASALLTVYERIHEVVTKSALSKHFDETSWRDRGKNHFVWVASTNQAVCFKIDPSRSREAFYNFIGSLAEASVVTDRYAVYNNVSKIHQYCLAHLIRDFRKFAERKGWDGEIGEAIVKSLCTACKAHRNYKQGKITLKSQNIRLGHLRKKIEGCLIDGMANGSDDLAKFCENILDVSENLWMFAKSTDIEPTNNLAERDLRKLVLWRKKSYGTRSDRGQRFVERISSIAATLRRKSMNIINFLNQAVFAFYSRLDAPHICSAAGY